MNNPQRTVTLSLTAEDMIRIAEKIGTWDKLWEAIGYLSTWDKLWEAIGYLSTWNLSYPTVTIFRDGGDDLVAVYHKEDKEQAFVIGAVWNGTGYGFHS